MSPTTSGSATGGANVGNWGRWGPDDQIGAVNLLTPERVLAALATARRGEIVPLGSEVGKNGAVAGGRNATWHVTTSVRNPHDPGRGRAEDVLTLHTHAHSHIDGLAHIWVDDHLYNGFPSSHVGRGGAGRLSIANVGGIVARGVLLDVAASGTVAFAPGTAISVADLEEAAGRAGVEVLAGDAVLVRTGWFDRFLAGDPVFEEGQPGLSAAATDWLAARDPVLVGMDVSALEPIPAAPGVNPLYVHETLLRDHGIFMVELLNLTPLADKGATSFLFMLAPLQVDRGLGSPVNPLAVL